MKRISWLRSASRWLRNLRAQLLELEERRMLVEHPWEEEFLHWSLDGGKWCLHGKLIPPQRKAWRSTTCGGWCPARSASPTENESK